MSFKDIAVKYLNVYLGPADWKSHMARLYSQLSKKGFNNLDIEFRNQVSCAILLPYFSGQKPPGELTDLIYKCRYYHQFQDRDWWEELSNILEEDEQVLKTRHACVSEGYVSHVKLSPITRQAFNWAFGSALDSGVVDESNKASIADKFEGLIKAYGGTPINSIYVNHKDLLNRVPNWRTNYFLEKAVFKTFSLEQLISMKQNELSKTNEKIVVSISA